ncbi:hypothetical protein [Deinococcus pimensis]|uniref:hypothetical protein n=1 Tax=Deinococcus pimensis TaxID=309888 RepID=UPI0004898667|nr:hypothetical protein [Deinococcus pimensis]
MQTMFSNTLTDVELVRRAALRALTEAIVRAFQHGRTDLDHTLIRLRTHFFMAPATCEEYGAVLNDALAVLEALDRPTKEVARDSEP